MADEPKNSQQIIDNATNALGQAQPDLLVVPQKPMKKKGGKGMLIGILLFLILTLPVAIYYGFQQYTQITESRSKAVAPLRIRTCYSTLVSCQNACKAGSQMFYCKTDTHSCIGTTDLYTDVNTCAANVRQYGQTPNTGACWASQASCQSACQAGSQMFYCKTDTHSCIGTTDLYTDVNACATNVRQYGQKPNTGACWASQASCQSACQAGSQMFYCKTDTHSCIGTTDLYTDVNTCAANVRQYGQTPNTGACWASQASCQSACATSTPTNTPLATNTPTNTPVATNTPTNTPTVYNTPAPGQCDSSCDSDSNCESGLYCYLVTGVRRCRKDACPDRSDCTCPLAQATPVYVYQEYTQPGQPAQVVRVVYQPGQPTQVVERVIAEAPIVTATGRPTPKVPVSGAIDVKAIVIFIGSILLLALGLIL